MWNEPKTQTVFQRSWQNGSRNMRRVRQSWRVPRKRLALSALSCSRWRTPMRRLLTNWRLLRGRTRISNVSQDGLKILPNQSLLREAKNKMFYPGIQINSTLVDADFVLRVLNVLLQRRSLTWRSSLVRLERAFMSWRRPRRLLRLRRSRSRLPWKRLRYKYKIQQDGVERFNRTS